MKRLNRKHTKNKEQDVGGNRKELGKPPFRSRPERRVFRVRTRK
jgi:hypothetical protein